LVSLELALLDRSLLPAVRHEEKASFSYPEQSYILLDNNIL
jgi:hypothetical protein